MRVYVTAAKIVDIDMSTYIIMVLCHVPIIQYDVA